MNSRHVLLGGLLLLAFAAGVWFVLLRGSKIAVKRTPLRVVVDRGVQLHTGFGAIEGARVILDTDVGNDMDDALALAMLHALVSREEAVLLAVTITNRSPWAGPFVDAVNTFYGRGELPIGVIPPDSSAETLEMIRGVVERRREDGSPVYPRDVEVGAPVEDALTLLRRTLAGEQDSSVTLVQIGPSTNLARLLMSPPDSLSPLTGRELAVRKVKLLSAMAGEYVHGNIEHNVGEDLASATLLFQDWPTDIVVSGFETGISLWYPRSSIENHFRYTLDHPIVEAYRYYYNTDRREQLRDQATFDLTSVLYAIRPGDGYFGTSLPGYVIVDEDGRTSFKEADHGRHRLLTTDHEQRLRALEAMVYLVTQPPVPQGRAAER